MTRPVQTLLACLAVFAFACGGSSSNQPATASGTAAATSTDGSTDGKEAKGAEPPVAATPVTGMADKPATKPAAGDLTEAQAETVFKRFLTLLSGAADDVAAAGGDCAKITVALNTWTDKNAAEAKTIFQQLPKVVKHKPVIDKHGGEMAAIQGRFGQLVSGCSGDESTKAAAKRFLGALQGQ